LIVFWIVSSPKLSIQSTKAQFAICSNGDRLAHNPAVAGSNPVPATKESGHDQAKRAASIGWRPFRFVNDRPSGSVVRKPSKTAWTL
jgi:hypothetical protein